MINNKLTKEAIENLIVKKDFIIVGNKTTICTLTLVNKFEVVGQSACIDVANFDKELGEKFAYEQALEKLFEFQAYHMHWKLIE